MKKIEFVVFNKDEGSFESFVSDFTTFGFLALCIWFSQEQGGGWWTFFTYSMFLFLIGVKAISASGRQKKLRTKKEAVDWANSLPED